MKLRDTVILVVLAHVGLVLVWICMGGCANNKAQEPKEQVAAVTDEGPGTGLPPLDTEVRSEEPPIVIEEAHVPSDIILPEPGETTPVPMPEETTVEPSPEEIRYVVKKGDTLWALSRRFKVPISAIVDRNDIQNAAMIREGRELIIPVGASDVQGPSVEAESPAAGAPTALPGDTLAVPVAEDAENAIHRVEPGDTLWALARRYGTEATKIMEANNITEPTKLRVGQELRIPKGE